MQFLSVRAGARFRDLTEPLGQAAVGALTIGILRTGRYFDPIRTVNLFGRIAGSIGPMTREQKIGRRLRRQIECPIHGARIIRLPGNRFRGELSEEAKPAHDAAGKIDIQGTMQAVTSVIENWIREYPDQWLWLHRRWR